MSDKSKEPSGRGKPIRELTPAQRRTAEEAIRDGLEKVLSHMEIRRTVNERLGFTLAPQAFKLIYEPIRHDFAAGCGFSLEAIRSAVDKRLLGVLRDPKTKGELVVKVIRECGHIFDLQRKPEEDAEIIQEVVNEEMNWIRGLSDRQLEDYVVQLTNPKLDEQFQNKIEAKKRGQIYAIERGEIITDSVKSRNLTEKPIRRKRPKRNGPAEPKEPTA